MSPRGSLTYPLLHVGNNLLGVGDLLPRHVVVVRRVVHGQLYLLVLQLQLGASDCCLKLRGGLLTQGLVHVLHTLGLVVVGGDDRRELECQRELEVRLGDQLVLLRVQALLVRQGLARVRDGILEAVGRNKKKGYALDTTENNSHAAGEGQRAACSNIPLALQGYLCQ